MARRGFKHRLKITRDSIERFCHDLKIVKMLSSPDRPGSSADTVSLLSEEDEEKAPCFKPRPYMERLDLTHIGGPSEIFKDDEGVQPVITSARKNLNFDLPRSPRIETTTSADRNVELKRLRRKSIDSPRTFLNGLSGIDSLPAVIAKKENNVETSQVLLDSLRVPEEETSNGGDEFDEDDDSTEQDEADTSNVRKRTNPRSLQYSPSPKRRGSRRTGGRASAAAGPRLSATGSSGRARARNSSSAAQSSESRRGPSVAVRAAPSRLRGRTSSTAVRSPRHGASATGAGSRARGRGRTN